MVVACLVLVVVVVAGVGAYFVLGTSSRTTTSVTAATSLPTIASASSSNASRTQPSSSVQQVYPFKQSTSPAVVLLAPGVNESYVTVQAALSSAPAAFSGEVVTLNGSAPGGILLKLGARSTTLGNYPAPKVPVTLAVSKGTPPGNYSIQLLGQSDGISESDTLSVRVVQYLVYMENYTFVPQNMTVEQGGTVFWMNLDGPHILCNAYDPGYHSVVFTTGAAVTTRTSTTSTTTTSASSPTPDKYDTWSYTFMQPGPYWYYPGLQPTRMNATVTVTPG